MSRRMLVIGCYGCGNRGDDAILQGICSLFPEWEITAFNGAFEDVSEYLPVRTVSCRMNEGASFSVICSLVWQLFSLIREVYHSDAVVYGGGSLIHDLTPYNLPFQFFWVRLAKLLGKKVYFFSIGIGPVKTKAGKKLCRRNLLRSEGVFVRDQRGFEICKGLEIWKAKITADAAFAICSQSSCREKALEYMHVEAHKYICVTACQWFRSENFWKRNQLDFSEETENLAFCIMEIYRELHMPILFVPTVADDILLGRQVEKLAPGVDFRLCPDHWNTNWMAAMIENSYLLIGMRMHSIIMAARQGVPFAAIIYDEKVNQLLYMMAMEQYGVALESITPEILLKLIRNIREKYSSIQKQLLMASGRFSHSVRKSAAVIKGELGI